MRCDSSWMMHVSVILAAWGDCQRITADDRQPAIPPKSTPPRTRVGLLNDRGSEGESLPSTAITTKAIKWRVDKKLFFYGVRPTSFLTNARPTRPLRPGPSDKKVAKLELRFNGSRNIPCDMSGPAQMSRSPTSQPSQCMGAAVFSSLSYETKVCGREPARSGEQITRQSFFIGLQA